jgi:hypothetical protein
MSCYHRILWSLIALIVLTQAFIELQLVYGRINVPVADAAALVLSALFGLGLLRTHRPGALAGVARFSPAGSGGPAAPPLPLVAPAAWAGLLGVGLIAWALKTSFYFDCFYFLLRKPLFNYVVYGAGLTGVLLALRSFRVVYVLSLCFAALAAGACITAAIPLWMLGFAATFIPIPHLTINHKTFAVALAPYLPFLWMGRHLLTPAQRQLANAAILLTGTAILLSISKTAWITAVFGLAGLMPLPGGRRRLLERPALMLSLMVASTGAMMLLPFLVGSSLMTDAFDSRMSLNLRAWEMFRDNWLIGLGPGTSTLFLMFQAPHTRINGVDAHGVIQKIAPEFGLLGLAAWLAFTWTLMRGLWRTAFDPAAHPDPLTRGAVAMGLALHVNLLLSTEYFTSSHWVPLSIALAIALDAGSRASRTDAVIDAVIDAGDRDPRSSAGLETGHHASITGGPIDAGDRDPRSSAGFETGRRASITEGPISAGAIPDVRT